MFTITRKYDIIYRELFLKELKMRNIKNLISNTFRDYQTNAAADPDMAKMYADDYLLFQEVARYLETGVVEDIKRAAQIIERMDTAPREDIVIACGMDFGAAWVKEFLGWNVEGWV